MLALLKRHIISLSLLILCGIVGAVIYMRETPIDMWLIEYEFETGSELPDYLQSDTVFQYNDLVCRNYIASIGDTLTEEGVRRYELKMYIPKSKSSDDVMTNSSEEILPTPPIKIVKRRYIETQKNRAKILYWLLVGFFLGIVVELVISLKKKPHPD